jgi:AcrR family transcriptional regulator
VTQEDPAVLGWRERKKLATRDAIGHAALRLALQVGPENVRVEEIAAAAGVSPRTFNNYFSSREEAICALREERTQQLVAALRERPADEPLDEALRAVIMQTRGALEPDKATIKLIATAPAIRAQHMRGLVLLEGALAEAIADRTGIDLAVDPGPRVVAAAFAAALRIASEYWLRRDDDMPFTDVLRDTLDRVSPIVRALPIAPSAAGRRPAQPDRKSSAC